MRLQMTFMIKNSVFILLTDEYAKNINDKC